MAVEHVPAGEAVVEAGTEEVAIHFKHARRKGLTASVPFFFPQWATTHFVYSVQGEVVSVAFSDPPTHEATLRWVLLQT